MYLINMKISQRHAVFPVLILLHDTKSRHCGHALWNFCFQRAHNEKSVFCKNIYLNECSTHMVKSIGKTWQKERKRNDECSVFYFFVKSKNLCVHGVCIVKMDTGNECWYISLERCQTWRRDISLDVKVHTPVNELIVSEFGQSVGRWSIHVGFLFFFKPCLFVYTEKSIYVAFYLWDIPYNKSPFVYQILIIIISVKYSSI